MKFFRYFRDRHVPLPDQKHMLSIFIFNDYVHCTVVRHSTEREVEHFTISKIYPWVQYVSDYEEFIVMKYKGLE